MVTVRYFAGAAEAAGIDREQVAASSLGELIAAVVAAHGPGLQRVIEQCSLLAGGVYVRDPELPLAEGATVDVLPPFAGG
ncbi:MAG: molybdopterin synthase sulfur carrier subunit [Actinobacteria bacterium HGW-Actinobacteria-5]|jgi:molybdopterin converting factor small subunit|nr:MAG: molybdopterin synthase sulfur carrier subunit [Actinobacteria bacterium HGW-Actinobacteria-5]